MQAARDSMNSRAQATCSASARQCRGEGLFTTQCSIKCIGQIMAGRTCERRPCRATRRRPGSRSRWDAPRLRISRCRAALLTPPPNHPSASASHRSRACGERACHLQRPERAEEMAVPHPWGGGLRASDMALAGGVPRLLPQVLARQARLHSAERKEEVSCASLRKRGEGSRRSWRPMEKRRSGRDRGRGATSQQRVSGSRGCAAPPPPASTVKQHKHIQHVRHPAQPQRDYAARERAQHTARGVRPVSTRAGRCA